MSSERNYLSTDSSESDSDHSTISITSTHHSEEGSDDEFPIKELLADKYCETRKKQVYLVHWEG